MSLYSQLRSFFAAEFVFPEHAELAYLKNIITEQKLLIDSLYDGYDEFDLYFDFLKMKIREEEVKLRHNRFQYNLLKNKLFKLHNFIITVLKESSSLETAEIRVLMNPLSRGFKNYIQIIFENIHSRWAKIHQRQLLKALIRNNKLNYIKNNKHNYNILECECICGNNDCHCDTSGHDCSPFDECKCDIINSDSEILDFNVRHKKVRVVKKRPIVNYGNVLSDREIYYKPKIVEVNPNVFILTRLKARIEAFRLARLKSKTVLDRLKYNIDYYYKKLLNFTHSVDEHPIEMVSYCDYQMEDAHGESNLQSSEAGNVTLMESRQEQPAILPASSFNWCSLSSSDIKGSFNEMVNRWLKVKTFKWEGESVNTPLVKLILPYDLVVSDLWTPCSLPNTIPFKVHRYWRGDMEIKIQLNSNKFQVGQLQCAWFYEPWLDDKFSIREDIASCSQTDHVLISAGSSNEVTLKVAYKNHLPMLSTKKRSDYDRVLSMGALYIRVLNMLRTPEKGPKSATGTVFVKFSNCEFTGQISGDLDAPTVADHQMDTVVRMATAALNEVACPNMDNPPLPQAPRYIVPTASHSWAYGTGTVEPLHSLRLDSHGQTAHPDALSYEGTMLYVARKFGYVKTFEWKVGNEVGAPLFSCDASPIMELTHYRTLKAQGLEHTAYYIPPVGVVSSLYNYWRGSMEYRFDLVASQFHTGRLIVGYVPGATAATPVTLQTLLAGPHIVFTLQEDQQFSYEVPYIADRPFWGRQYNGNYAEDKVKAPSRLYVFVLNPLVNMESIVDSVEINLYMRASTNFEVSIPVQPSLGLGYNRTVIYSDSLIIHATAGTSPYYIGYSSSFLDSARLILRYAQTGVSLSLFPIKYLDKMKKKPSDLYIYKIHKKENVPDCIINGDRVRPEYYVGVYTEDKKNMMLCPIQSKDMALQITKQYVLSKFTLSTIAAYLLPATSTTSNVYSQGDPGFEVELVAELDDSYEVVDHQGERENDGFVITIDGSFSTTRCGRTLFGESFYDLKDLCRRYQVYCGVSIMPTINQQLGQCSFVIPVLPQGLDLQLGTSQGVIEFGNRCRDGIIPIVLSGYRYYRGGLRFRIVVPTARDLIIWLQHRPDRKLRNLSVMPCSDVVTAEGVANHGYASYIQDTGVNSIIEIEVPFYQNSSFGLLQRPRLLTTNESFYYGLGEIAVGALYTKLDSKAVDKAYTGTMYYSLADDFQFSTFQGFPPCIILDDIDEVGQHQGMFDNMFASVKSSIRAEVEDAVKDNVSKITEEVSDVVDDLTQKIEGAGMSSFLQNSHIRAILNNVAHTLANFNVKSVAISIGFILIDLSILTTEVLSDFLMYVSKIFKRIKIICETSGNQPNQPDIAEEAHHHMDINPDDGATMGIITILWTALCSVLCIKNTSCDLKGFEKLLTKDMKNVMTSSNALFVFLRNIFSVMEQMKQKIFGIFSPKSRILDSLNSRYPEIKTWAEEVLKLDDPKMFEDNKYTHGFKSRVNLAYMAGCKYYSDVALLDDQSIVRPITDFYRKIRSVREKMIETGDDYLVRKEPFVLWSYGGSGLGKSTMTHDLVVHLLKSRNKLTSVSPIYVHNASSEYWDSCHNNPALVVDDMFAIQSGDAFEKQLALLFAVVSPVVLCPPKARIEDKGRPYNPEIVVMNSNYAFMRFNGVHMDAIHRRRNILYKVELSNIVKPGCRHCKEKLSLDQIGVDDLPMMEDYHHLHFFIARNIMKDEQHNWQGPYMYSQFITELAKRYNKVMDKNDAMYTKRVTEMVELIKPMEDTTMVDTLLYYKQRQREWFESIYQESYISDLRNAANIYKDAIEVKFQKVKEYLRGYLPSDPVFSGEDDLTSPSKRPEVKYALSDFEKYLNQTTIEAEIHQEPEQKAKSTNPFMESYNQYEGPTDEIELAEHNMDVWKTQLPYYSYYGVESLCDNKKLYFSEECRLNMYMSPKLARLMCVIDEHMARSTLPTSDMENIVKLVSGAINGRLNQDNFLGWLVHYKSQIAKHIDHRINRQLCGHLENIHPRSCYLEGGRIKHQLYGDVTYSCVKKRDESKVYCMMENPFFAHIWYTEFLMYHPNISLLTSGTRILTEQERVDANIPTIFMPPERHHIEFPDMTKWQEICNRSKNALVDGFLAIKPTVRKIWNIIKEVAKFLEMCMYIFACVMLPIGMLAIGGSLLYHDFKDYKREAAWEQGPSYSTNTKTVLNEKFVSASQQAAPPQLDVCVKRVKDNTFRITACFDESSVTCYGLVLKGRTVLLLRHYIEELEHLPANTVFYGCFSNRKICEGSKGVPFDFKSRTKTFFNYIYPDGTQGSNMATLDLGLEFPECKDLTTFFATEKLHTLNRGNCMLVHNDGTVYANIFSKREKKKLLIRPRGHSSAVTLTDVYSYPMQHRGMCGSVLLSNDLERPIIGIHVAGVESGDIRGIAEILTFEMFNKLPQKEKNFVECVIPQLDDVEFAKLNFDTHIFPIGTVTKDYFVHQSAKTALVPSLIQGVFPVTTAPNPLSPSDSRLPPNSSPLKLGIEHMGKPANPFPNSVLCVAMDSYNNKILSSVKPLRSEVGVLSFEQAVVGIPGIDGYEPLEWSTSPGFPLRFLSKASGKKHLFDLEETAGGFALKGFKPELQNILVTKDAMRQRGVKPFTVFIDCLKDTCLPVEKNSIPGKTRIFSISPVDFTIQFKQYFGDFMAAFQRSRLNAEHAIGINVDSIEWTTLASYLQEKGEKIVCGDYKNYGPSVLRDVSEKAFEIILNWYKLHGDDKNNKIRRIMMEEVLGAYHLATNVVYRTPCGIPSGSPITTPLNSMIGSLYIRCVWFLITGLSFEIMEENCNIVTYGDDLCVNVSDNYIDIFNTVTMEKCFARFNIVFTDADKSGLVIPYRNLDTASFLKRKFVPHPWRSNIYLAELPEDSIYGCANWIRNKGSHAANTIENAEQCLQLAHCRGKVFYNNIRDKLIKALQSFDLTMRIKSWDEIDRERYDTLL